MGAFLHPEQQHPPADASAEQQRVSKGISGRIQRLCVRTWGWEHQESMGCFASKG